jgi:hypothetical protein
MFRQLISNNKAIKKSFRFTSTLSSKYTIIDHTYDAVVIGAGGAGLRYFLYFSIFKYTCFDSSMHIIQ